MRSYLKPFVASIVLLGLGSSAHAGTISFTGLVQTKTVDFSDQVTLTKFDTSLGTLTGVTLSLLTNANATVTVENKTGSDKTYHAVKAFVPVTIFGPNDAMVAVNAIAERTYGTAGQPSTHRTIANGQTITESGLTSTANGSSVVPSSAWSEYKGVGIQDLVIDVIADPAVVQGRGAAGVQYSATGEASAQVTVTYTYISSAAAAPEPGTAALLALAGVPGVAICRRKQERRRTGNSTG